LGGEGMGLSVNGMPGVHCHRIVKAADIWVRSYLQSQAAGVG
jgi:hypothetical protein